MAWFILIALAIAYFIYWVNKPVAGKITNEEYEARFKELVYMIDSREPKWINASLRQLKKGYSYYWQNARAIAMLKVLEETTRGEHPEVERFILSCNKYRKKAMI